MEGLNELLLQISSQLGIGIEFLKANFMESLPEIGRYLIAKELLTEIPFSIFLFYLLYVFTMMGTYIFHYEYNGEEGEFKQLIKKTWFYPIVISIILSLVEIIPYLISPQFWTIQKLLEMVK